MVRKRSRASRKHYDSDENDSDSDFELDDPPTGRVQKKYSLRQRKRPLFTEDFDYDEDGEEVEPAKASSDDEDFEVEKELELGEAADTEYIDKTTYINHYEPEADDIPEGAEGLIDFEDMIRADIVVNKNRIDYDNIIQKTEIKVQPIEEVQPVKSRRGRKPKVRPAEELDTSILEPETEVQEETEYEDKRDKDYNPNDDLDNEEVLDCAAMVQAELKEAVSENETLPSNEDTTLNSTKLPEVEAINTQKEEEGNNPGNIPQETLPQEIPPQETPPQETPHQEIPPQETPQEISPEEISPQEISQENNISQESVIKVNDNVSKDTMHFNGNVSSNNVKEAEEKLLEVTKREITVIDDDDVVLIEDEKKCEVIVLDD